MACSCDGQKINYFIFKVPRHYFNIMTPTAFHITKLGLHVRGEPSGFDNLYEQLLEHAFFFWLTTSIFTYNTVTECFEEAGLQGIAHVLVLSRHHAYKG